MIDTSIWIALIRKKDTCNDKAKKIVKNISTGEISVFDHIYAETLTVARNKNLPAGYNSFIKLLKDCKIKIRITNEKIFTLANFLFFRFKKLSFTDCLLLASAKQENAKILSFDKSLLQAWQKMCKK